MVQEGRRLTFSKRKVIASVEDLDEFDQFLLEKVSALSNIMQHRAYVVHLLEAIIWEDVVRSPHMEAYVRMYVHGCLFHTDVLGSKSCLQLQIQMKTQSFAQQKNIICPFKVQIIMGN